MVHEYYQGSSVIALSIYLRECVWKCVKDFSPLVINTITGCLYSAGLHVHLGLSSAPTGSSQWNFVFISLSRYVFSFSHSHISAFLYFYFYHSRRNPAPNFSFQSDANQARLFLWVSPPTDWLGHCYGGPRGHYSPLQRISVFLDTSSYSALDWRGDKWLCYFLSQNIYVTFY